MYAIFAQDGASLLIIEQPLLRIMLCTIHFNDKLGLVTIKISDKTRYYLLSLETNRMGT